MSDEMKMQDRVLTTPPRRKVTGIRRLVMLDRYAKKYDDPLEAIRRHLEHGEEPVVVANISEDPEKPQIIIGLATDFDSDGVYVYPEDSGGNDLYYVPLERVAVPMETAVEDIWDRMAQAVAEHPAYTDDKDVFQDFRWLLDDFRFVPAGRIWSGLGTGYNRTLINCYVFPIEPDGGPTAEVGCDSRQAILDTLHKMVETMSRGGGVGLNLGVLRPKGAVVRGVAGHSSGAVSWGDIYSFATGLISQGGSRRGALLELMPVWHPDVKEFIQAKMDPNRLVNCNISVGLTREFEEAVHNDDDFDLVFPDLDRVDRETYNLEWDGNLASWKAKGLPVKVYERVRARELFRMIVESAWASAEPGIVRLDYANDQSNSKYYAELIGTNPCGEQPLPPYGVCNLGHINLSRFIYRSSDEKKWVMNWEDLGKAVRLAVRFLDAVIDLDPYHLPEVKERQLSERRIGLGTMGLAELLIRMELRYGSPESLKFIDRLYEFIRNEAYLESVELAREFGPFPRFDSDRYLRSPFVASLPHNIRDRIQKYSIRNVTLLTQAPTGSVGTMAGTSTGIEPYFQFRYFRSGRLGQKIEVVEPIIQDLAYELGRDPLKEDLDYLVTAMDLAPEDHIRVQATIQKYTDASISKTANLPSDYTVDQTEEIYRLALELGCKGVTVYRDQSRREQVLSLADQEPKAEPGRKPEPEPPAVDENRASDVLSVAPSVDQSAALPARPPVHRPGVVEGYTERVKTPVGKLYITTNFVDGDPIEVFVKGPAQKSLPGEAEGMLVPREQYEQALAELSALTEALGIVLSEAMKWGASPERLARQLSMAKGTFFFHKDDHAKKGIGLRGVTAAVAHAMQEAMRLRREKPWNGQAALAEVDSPGSDGDTSDAGQPDESPQPAVHNPCPVCGSAMVKTDCWYCPECGYSKCS